MFVAHSFIQHLPAGDGQGKHSKHGAFTLIAVVNEMGNRRSTQTNQWTRRQWEFLRWCWGADSSCEEPPNTPALPDTRLLRPDQRCQAPRRLEQHGQGRVSGDTLLPANPPLLRSRRQVCDGCACCRRRQLSSGLSRTGAAPPPSRPPLLFHCEVCMHVLMPEKRGTDYNTCCQIV